MIWLMCGDREWTDRAAVEACFSIIETRYGPITRILQGMCRGLDQIADAVAREKGISSIGFPAEWKLYGRAAGPKRNQLMLEVGKPRAVLAFHADLAKSKGTLDMMKRAVLAGLPVFHFNSRDFYAWNVKTDVNTAVQRLPELLPAVGIHIPLFPDVPPPPVRRFRKRTEGE